MTRRRDVCNAPGCTPPPRRHLYKARVSQPFSPLTASPCPVSPVRTARTAACASSSRCRLPCWLLPCSLTALLSSIAAHCRVAGGPPKLGAGKPEVLRCSCCLGLASQPQAGADSCAFVIREPCPPCLCPLPCLASSCVFVRLLRPAVHSMVHSAAFALPSPGPGTAVPPTYLPPAL